MKDKYEIIMAGSGGQGLVSCGIILAEAAIIEGQNAAQTQSYGIATRGGFSKSEVVISRNEIIFQQVQEPDVVLALTEQAMEMYATIESQIPVFYDTTLLKIRVGDNLYGYPFTELASKLGHVGTANIIALGAMAAKTNMVQIESLALALKKRFSGKVAEMNIKALNIGVELERDNN
ncbi:2-oxoglutarate ferredoxin oxidoreductase subunit gamma [Desulfotomaculum arcticum]|uniref:2-oxoglutarate ferredoxin oxidoreductase subunit gamma n=1 Tax=Desulfotruncus arcticus DSM 17038 TaxID=1121424 RepID=A0A1I2WP66_9FIRM|nr:2-oxoacid:acceptor oxidoreductase family protein [Desulfotruncus arcticus]SFH02992.1 2-oxoglutarate ferredoxin oxidoreductase subunit gamma [Desulfotomaculum arcticum] [Desulfotruncus arcticus DSM 17038]